MSGNCNQKAITETVERIAASGALGAGERQLALLRYLTNEELAGRGDQLKAYSIATNVLARSPTFDPSQDAIVRVEIGRLRKTLELFFATQGRNSPLYIVIDKGTYRPRFVVGSDSTAQMPPERTALLESSLVPVRQKPRPKSQTAALLGGFLLLLSIAVASLLHFSQNTHDPAKLEPPLLLVEKPEITGVIEQAPMLRLALQNAMIQELRTRDWLSVALVEAAPHRQVSSKAQPAFHIRTFMAAISEHYLVTVILEKEPAHEIVWTGRIEGEFDRENLTAFQGYLAQTLSNDLANLNGPLVEAVAVHSEKTSAEADKPYRCMINARRYLRFNGVKQFHDAKACLTKQLDQDPSQNSLRATLVYLLIEEAITPHLSPLPATIGGSRITNRARRRDALLKEAENLLDTSIPTERHLLAARLTLAACRGQTELVRSRLPALRTLQSNNADSYIAMGLLAGPVLGEWPLAISAEARAFSLKANPLPWFQFVSAIKAGMDEDSGLALRMLSRVPMHESALGSTLIVAFGREAGATLRVSNARANLARQGYTDNAALTALVDDSCYSAAVKQRIKRGILTPFAALPPPRPILDMNANRESKTPGSCETGC